jgi:hypothetical protein
MGNDGNECILSPILSLLRPFLTHPRAPGNTYFKLLQRLVTTYTQCIAQVKRYVNRTK